MKRPEARLCPHCGKEYLGEPALSRVDNSTLICSECSTREALEIAGITGAAQDEIIEEILRHIHA